MKKNCALVTGGTKNHFPAMATLVLNIKDKCPNLADDIIIFHDGVPIKQQKILNKVCPVKFVYYETPFDENVKFSVNYFTNMVFCKYECWNLLKEYKTVIWLDYDMLILDNLLELLDNKDNCECKFCPSDFLGAKIDRLIYRKPYFTEFDKKYVMRGGACVHAGMFVLHDNFPNYETFYKKCIEYSKKYSEVIIEPEEAIISLIFQEEKYKIKYLGISTYSFNPRLNPSLLTETKILHTTGHPKFWESMQNEQWNSYYKQWTKEYKGEKFKKIKIKKILQCLVDLFIPDFIIWVLLAIKNCLVKLVSFIPLKKTKKA